MSSYPRPLDGPCTWTDGSGPCGKPGSAAFPEVALSIYRCPEHQPAEVTA
jgi:hypothetical protein